MLSASQKIISFTGNVAEFLVRNRDNIKDVAVPTAVCGILGVQTLADINHVKKKEDKRNTIINNIIIGVAMMIGGWKSHGCMKNFLGTDKAKRWGRSISSKLSQEIKQRLKTYPVKDYLEALSVPAGAGIAGGIGGEIAQRLFPVNDDVREEVMDRAELLTAIDYDSVNKVMGVDTLGAAKSMDTTFSTIIGIPVGKEKGIKNKVKRFVFELVSGCAIPLAILIPVTGYVNKAFEKSGYNKSLIRTVKGGIIVGGGIATAMLGKFVANWVNRQIEENIAENKYIERASIMQKKLVEKAKNVHNPIEKEKVLKEITRIKEFKREIKED